MRTCLLWLLAVYCSFTSSMILHAQQPPAAPAPAETVQLNFPNEIEVQVFADFVSQRLGIKILYDETIRNKKFSLRAPGEIPVTSLPGILESVLKMKGLAIIDAEVPGWKRIVVVNRMQDFSVSPDQAQNQLIPVTETFELKYADLNVVDQTIKTFLTSQGSNSIAIKEAGLLIVTDYANNIERIRGLIRSLDVPPSKPRTEFYTCQHLPADQLTASVNSILTALASKSGENRQATGQLLPDKRTNQITIVGDEVYIQEALRLLERFDVSTGLITQVYQLQNTSADRLDTLFKELLGPLEKELSYESKVDTDGNLLIVRATPDVHQRLQRLVQDVDITPPKSESPVQFVRLKHANVKEVLQSLQALGTPMYGPAPPPFGLPAGAVPPAVVDPNAPLGQLPVWYNPNAPQGGLQSPIPGINMQRDLENNLQPVSPQAGVEATPSIILPGGLRISGDTITNSLILVGPAEVQRDYADLIQALDRQRPQVMIEAHIIAIDTSDNFALGVEVSGGDRSGLARLFQFTSFGLSEVDPVTGALQIIPGLGFNGTLVNPEVADVVVRALASHTRAKVLASPKILVNDNTAGSLENVLSVPFASVNASNTVSTTSLGGNQQAGTSINVTPHIKEGNELELEFAVEFSSFSTTGGTQSLPPPRQISRAESVITIPDGNTVIVGGLKQIGKTKTLTGIPIIEYVPLLNLVSSNRTKDKTTTSFFLFIRPTVIRHDKFEELKYHTKVESRYAGISTRFPPSQPMMIPTSRLPCPPVK